MILRLLAVLFMGAALVLAALERHDAPGRLCRAINGTRQAQVDAYEFMRAAVLAGPPKPTGAKRARIDAFFDGVEQKVKPIAC